jgi:hypothetical protein
MAIIFGLGSGRLWAELFVLEHKGCGWSPSHGLFICGLKEVTHTAHKS